MKSRMRADWSILCRVQMLSSSSAMLTGIRTERPVMRSRAGAASDGNGVLGSSARRGGNLR